MVHVTGITDSLELFMGEAYLDILINSSLPYLLSKDWMMSSYSTNCIFRSYLCSSVFMLGFSYGISVSCCLPNK